MEKYDKDLSPMHLRLKDALGDQKLRLQICDEANVKRATVNDSWLKKGVYPRSELLIPVLEIIRKREKISSDWILLGEQPKYIAGGKETISKYAFSRKLPEYFQGFEEYTKLINFAADGEDYEKAVRLMEECANHIRDILENKKLEAEKVKKKDSKESDTVELLQEK